MDVDHPDYVASYVSSNKFTLCYKCVGYINTNMRFISMLKRYIFTIP
jgi:hypothetical protein